MCNDQIRIHSPISRTISEKMSTEVDIFRVVKTRQKIVPSKEMGCNSLANSRMTTPFGHNIAKESSHCML